VVLGSKETYTICKDYITSRKLVYWKKYREIAVKTLAFAKLKARLDNGENIQINEVDCPKFENQAPYNNVVNGSLEKTPSILKALINNPSQAFGHGYELLKFLLVLSFKI
jgi:hypothetical protein